MIGRNLKTGLVKAIRRLLGQPEARYILSVEDNAIYISLSPPGLARQVAQSFRTAETITLQVGPNTIRLIASGSAQDLEMELTAGIAFQLHPINLHCIIAAGNRHLVRRPIHIMQIFTDRLPKTPTIGKPIPLAR